MRLFYIKSSPLKNSLLLAVLSTSSSVFAQGSSVSPAEQAALDAQIQASSEHFEVMCNHAVLHAPDDVKAELIASLNGLTCAEAAAQQQVTEDASSND